jgi:hypothetical protein
MKNSHSAWRLYRQSAKHIVELATRAQDPEVAELLVELLNEHLDKCKALLNTEVGQQMARYIAGKDCIQQQESDVPAALDEAYATEPSKRTPKPINRFNPYHYDTKGREIDLTKPTLARKALKEQRRHLGYDALDEDDEAAVETEDLSGTYEDDGQTFVADVDQTTRAYQLQLDALRKLEREQSLMTDEAETLMAMVRLAHDGECTAADLEDSMKLRLGLLLLYHARIGKRNIIESSSIHIRYDKLPVRESAMEKYADSIQLDQALVTAAFTKSGAKTSSQVRTKKKKIKTGPARTVKKKAVVSDDVSEDDDEDDAEFELPEAESVDDDAGDLDGEIERGADELVATVTGEDADLEEEPFQPTSPIRASKMFKKLESSVKELEAANYMRNMSRFEFKASHMQRVNIRWAHLGELADAIFELAGAGGKGDEITAKQALDVLPNLHESYWPMLGCWER